VRLLGVFLLAACAPQYSVQGRPYELRIPTGVDATTPLPLVVMLHGYGVNGVGQDLAFPLSGQVNEKKFLYAMPSGTVDQFGKRFWNATDVCCNLGKLDVDDVGFFRALVADVAKVHPVKQGSVFIVGHSNGGFMGLTLACEAPELVAGVVSVAASTWRDPTRCRAGPPVPILLVHGTRDTSVPIEGREGVFPGARDIAGRFAGRNGCAGALTDVGRADFVSIPGEETQLEDVAGCPRTGAVSLWTIDQAPHLPVFDGRWSARTIDWLVEHAR
jgi:polyhydroxybutyrate depolymerase